MERGPTRCEGESSCFVTSSTNECHPPGAEKCARPVIVAPSKRKIPAESLSLSRAASGTDTTGSQRPPKRSCCRRPKDSPERASMKAACSSNTACTPRSRICTANRDSVARQWSLRIPRTLSPHKAGGCLGRIMAGQAHSRSRNARREPAVERQTQAPCASRCAHRRRHTRDLH